jgi:NitT/TauT family transport system substrate-binding protein
LGLAALLALAIPAAAQQKLTVGEGGQNSFSFKLLDVGIKKGIFAKHGLDVKAAEFAGGSRLQQALASGSIDIGLAGGTDLGAVAKGSPVKAVAEMGGAPLDFAIGVRPDSPIRTVTDLKGAKIGVTTLTSLTAWLTSELSRREGWGTDGIIKVAAGSSATSLALLKTKEVDGLTSSLGAVLQAEKVGEARLVVQFSQVLKNFVSFMIYAQNSLIKEHPEQVKAFLAGWFDTIAWANANRDETVEILSQMMGIDRTTMTKLYDQLMPMFSADGRFDPEDMKELALALHDRYGLKPEQLPALYTDAFLPER